MKVIKYRWDEVLTIDGDKGIERNKVLMQQVREGFGLTWWEEVPTETRVLTRKNVEVIPQ